MPWPSASAILLSLSGSRAREAERSRLVVARRQAVALAADGLDAESRGRTELRAQARDVHLDQVGPGIEVHAPDAQQELLARDRALLRLQQDPQDLELALGQLDRPSVAGRTALRRIDLQVSDAHGARPTAAAQHGPQTRQQLLEAQWLDQVIVGPRSQAPRAVGQSIVDGHE